MLVKLRRSARGHRSDLPVAFGSVHLRRVAGSSGSGSQSAARAQCFPPQRLAVSTATVRARRPQRTHTHTHAHAGRPASAQRWGSWLDMARASWRGGGLRRPETTFAGRRAPLPRAHFGVLGPGGRGPRRGRRAVAARAFHAVLWNPMALVRPGRRDLISVLATVDGHAHTPRTRLRAPVTERSPSFAARTMTRSMLGLHARSSPREPQLRRTHLAARFDRYAQAGRRPLLEPADVAPRPI